MLTKKHSEILAIHDISKQKLFLYDSFKNINGIFNAIIYYIEQDNFRVRNVINVVSNLLLLQNCVINCKTDDLL